MVSEPTPTASAARGTTPVGGSAEAGAAAIGDQGEERHSRPATYWLGAFLHRLSKTTAKTRDPSRRRFGRDPAIREAQRRKLPGHPHTACVPLRRRDTLPGAAPER